MNKKPRLNQKPLKAYDVALYFLNMAKINQQSIDSLKIQKMLYYAQAESLVFCGKPLFKENIEAWDNGPMVYDVYRKFREYGSRLIDFKELKHFRPNKFSKNNQEILAFIFETTIGFTATELVHKTHSETPWREHYESTMKHKVIPNQSIAAYFNAQFLQELRKEYLFDTIAISPA